MEVGQLLLRPIQVVVHTTNHIHVDQSEKIPDRELEKLFRRLDSADGTNDGRISRKHLIAYFSEIDGYRKSGNFRRASELISEADSNDDGFITRDEMVHLFEKLRTENPVNEQHVQHHKILNSYLRRIAEAERFRCCPPPWLIFVLVISQVAFFIYHIYHFKNHPAHVNQRINIIDEDTYPKCSKLIYNPYKRHEIWRYFSYFLVHASIYHLLINIFLQLLVGLLLEISHGCVRTLIVYIMGVIAGSLTASILAPTQLLAGSSGAVFALIGGHISSIVLNWKQDRILVRERLRPVIFTHQFSSTRRVYKLRTYRIIRLSFVVLLSILDFSLPWIVPNAHNQHVKVSYSTHVGGLASGFLMGIIILRNRKVEEWERYAKLISAIILGVFMFLMVFWNCFGNEVIRKMTGNPEDRFYPPLIRVEYDGHGHQCNYTK